MNRRIVIPLAAAFLAVVLLASPAGAHVEIDPAEATAGSTVTLTFGFHHGKDGTATTGLDVQLPEGVTLVELPPVEGWTGSFDEAERVVHWTGGSVPDGVEAAFPVVVELPATTTEESVTTTGELLFPTVQVTEAGELAWIDEEEGESEAANPAPRLTLVADPDATTTTSEPTTTTGEPTTTTDDADGDRPRTALEADVRDDGDNSAAPWLIGSGVAALLVVVAGGLLLKRRTG